MAKKETNMRTQAVLRRDNLERNLVLTYLASISHKFKAVMSSFGGLAAHGNEATACILITQVVGVASFFMAGMSITAGNKIKHYHIHSTPLATLTLPVSESNLQW